MSIYYLTIYNFAICLQRYNISGKQTRKIILKDTKKSKLKKVFDKKKKRGDSFFLQQDGYLQKTTYLCKRNTFYQ